MLWLWEGNNFCACLLPTVHPLSLFSSRDKLWRFLLWLFFLIWQIKLELYYDVFNSYLVSQTSGGGNGVAKREKHCFIFLMCKACPQQPPPSWQAGRAFSACSRLPSRWNIQRKDPVSLGHLSPRANFQPWNRHILFLSGGGPTSSTFSLTGFGFHPHQTVLLFP